MAKKKKAKKPVQSYDSPEKAIRERARKLPIYECLISQNWHNLKMAEIVVSRKHSNGNITYGVFLVDLYCTGLRDTFYSFNITLQSYEEMLKRMAQNIKFVPCSYELVHNIILGGIDYAGQFGFEPDKGFAVTEFILNEDTEDIPLLDIQFGYKGKPTILVFEGNNPEEDINTLTANAGEGDYSIMNIGKDTMHSDPENAMFAEPRLPIEEFMKESPKENFKEDYFIEFVKGAFNKKLTEDENLRQKNVLNYYVNDLICFPIHREEGLVKIKDKEIRDKYFEFYEAVENQKSRKVKKLIPEIEQYYGSNEDIPEFAALLLKCYLEIHDTAKFESLMSKSLEKYPDDFSTRAIAMDRYLSFHDYSAAPKLFKNCFTISEYVGEKKSVNITDTKLFHLAYFYYFLDKQNISQAEQYLKILSMYYNDEKAVKQIILKLSIAKLFYIDEKDQVKSILPNEFGL